MHMKRQNFDNCYIQEPVYWLVLMLRSLWGVSDSQADSFSGIKYLDLDILHVLMKFSSLTIQVAFIYLFAIPSIPQIITKRCFEKNGCLRMTEVIFSS